MPSTTGLCTAGLADAFSGRTYKIALYAGVDLDKTFDHYVPTNEVTGTGYTAGGKAVVPTVTLTTDGSGHDVALFDLADVTWPSSTISADTAVLYFADTGKAIQVFDLTGGTGTPVSSSSGTLTLDLPTSGYGVSLLQLLAA